ncbi:uncharacterized protein [Argopecten irradians]|uniref:uncharacterized protein n=1 Tax=Argopecten irradians TaxID=31199 RepID=UPI0037226854
MATAKIPVRTKGQTTCHHHKGRQLEFYCKNCQDLICAKCISSLHSGHRICELIEVTPRKKQDIKTFIDRTEKNDLVQIEKYITSTDTLLRDNDRMFEKLSQQLRMQTEKLKEDLDKLTTETLSLYQNMKKDNTKLIQKYKQDIEMYAKQLKQQMKDCKIALQQGSHIEIFDTKCEIDSQLHFPVKPTLGIASFTPNTTPQKYLALALGETILPRQAQSIGSLKNSGEKAVETKTLNGEVNVLEKWTPSCDISSICPTNDDQAWTSYNHSKTLTLLDRKGKVIQEVAHNVRIKDISLSPTTHRLWACDEDSNIMELVSGRLVRRFRAESEPWCICVTSRGNILLGMTKHISEHTTTGQMVRTSKSTLVYTPGKIAQCPVTDNIAVIVNDGMNKLVIVMDAGLGNILSGHMKPCIFPLSLVYDSVGNLIIGCYLCIDVRSGSNQSLLTWWNSVYMPIAIGVGRDDILWINDRQADGKDIVKVLHNICI